MNTGIKFIRLLCDTLSCLVQTITQEHSKIMVLNVNKTMTT